VFGGSTEIAAPPAAVMTSMPRDLEDLKRLAAWPGVRWAERTRFS